MRSDPVTPLWRGAQVLRLLSYLYALGFRIAIDDDLLHPVSYTHLTLPTNREV